MRLTGISLLASALLLAGAAPAVAQQRPTDPSAVVRTDRGLVRGQPQPGYRLFQGIPYAAPPTGSLRWRPPQPVRPWQGTYDATSPRSQCAQLAPPYGGDTTYGEDCLYLNVTTPDRAHRRHGLPVMVWVHGGGNTTGSGSVYNAAKLAVDGDVVVVTVNYRLGPLGWLAHPGLENGADRRYQAGNYGLLDQQAALRWAQRNARAFGGDPRNVTLFGESAGAADSCANLASPSAAGLFHKVIPESFSCATPVRTEASAEADAASLAKAVGCDQGSPVDNAACLRGVPVKTLLETFDAAGMSAGPVAGGDRVLPLQPAKAIEQGRFNRVPVMHGNTLDEMRLYVSLLHPNPMTEAQYESIVRSTYGDAAGAVLARYPARNYSDPRIALATIQTDAGGALSTCLHQDAFQLLERAGVPVYAYQFADRTAPPLIDVPGFDEGAEHATELTFLFPGLLGELDPRQQRLSDAMVGYWTSFAWNGRPKARHAPHWPRFRSPGDVLSLAPGARGIHRTDTARTSNCAFWDSL
ncbi:carboxylesterase/lipase family protein [Actinomadura madurae]|uniref:carboxylesterase/lipase family protein n=1 Tax=Actinomadura madurae TaxID=1993 RepID=UPI000D843CB7|nr:carboxylesterase family protein [Actinomadura madurae]SPT63199.1 Para-nitrobenzyl esterase [Actinomadura madurae]